MVHITFAMEQTKEHKAAKTSMLTIDEIHTEFPHLTEFQLRKRLKYLVEADLIEEDRADQYNQLLYSPAVIEFLEDLEALQQEAGNLKKALQMLVSKLKDDGQAYHLMSKEELVDIIHRQNRQIEQLQKKVQHLKAQFKPVERKGVFEWVRQLFRRTNQSEEEETDATPL